MHTDSVRPDWRLLAAAEHAQVAVFGSELPSATIINNLRRYLGKALADSTTLHGVCMDVLGIGVLITGDSGVGKSELGLELISRGHGLVADDAVDIARIDMNTLECRSPPMLKDFLEELKKQSTSSTGYSSTGSTSTTTSSMRSRAAFSTLASLTAKVRFTISPSR